MSGQIGHGSADRGEVEDPAWILLEFDAGGAGAFDRPFDGVDGSVEVFAGYLKGGVFGLLDLAGDGLVFGFESGVAAGLLFYDAGVLLVLVGIS